MRLLTTTITVMYLMLTQSCGDDYSEEQDTEEVAEEAVTEALDDYDRDNELEDLRDQIDAQNGDMGSSGAYLWEVEDIEYESMMCADSLYYDMESTIEDVERFCMCRTEMISVRWTYDDYRHHPFSYVDHLEKSQRLDRCTEPSKFSEVDEPEEIEEDQNFDPVAPTEEPAE